MKSKVVIVLAVCFLFMSLVSATTKLEIQTLPGYEIYISELDAYASSVQSVKQPLRTFSGESGKINIDYTPTKSPFDLGLLLKNDSKKIIPFTLFRDKFKDNTNISLIFLPSGVSVEDVLGSIEEEIEDTESNETETNETVTNETVILDSLIEDEEEIEDIETNESSEGILKGVLINGHAVYQENKLVVNLISYFLGAVVLIAPIYMLFKKGKFKRGSLIPDKLLKKDDDEEGEFDKAEADLKKARERIDDLKGDKIKKAKEKLIDDERELMRLRKLGKD
jgi:hypothetical protein